MRRCNKCGVEKPLTEFHNQSARRGGKAYTCKPCMNAYVKHWAQTSKGKESQRKAKRRYNQSESGRAAKREYGRRPEVRARGEARRLAYRETTKGRQAAFLQQIRQYGIDVEDWARLYNAQAGVCLGCCERLEFDRSTHVDHDHQTGIVRGLLCHGCNLSVGGAKDNPATLRRLALYLEAA